MAKRLSEAGDNSAFSKAFRNRHSVSFRLTKLGREQARHTGGWLQTEFRYFDRYYTSEYTRAKETAGLLGLPDAKWYCDFYLTERDWGSLDNYPENERYEKFGDQLRRRQIEPFFWSPPHGESFAQLCLRVDRVLHTLHRECSDKRVIIVCHGEVMRAFRVRIERINQAEFKNLLLSKEPADTIIHYPRRNPATGKLYPYANWMRRVRPSETRAWSSDWKTFERRSFTNEELLDMISKIPTMIE